MAQDRLAENLKIFESETDMRMSNLSKKKMSHFSASNMMLMSGAEPLTSPQTKEMQRLTDAYTAYLPSRVAHVG